MCTCMVYDSGSRNFDTDLVQDPEQVGILWIRRLMVSVWKKDIKKKEVQNQSEDHKVIFIVIIFVLFFVIATIILVLRRKYLLKQREKLLSQENINKKYIAYYDYLNELKQYNSEIENNYRYIALKAAYSNTVILQEELDEIRNYVDECLTLIQENNSSLKLLIYQYIYVLF